MGEGLPAMMERVDRVFSRYSGACLDRSAARAILDQVWVSTSGFTSAAAFLATLTTFGADRILFSVDYPFGDNKAAVDFLTALPLSPAHRQTLAHANADASLGLAPSRREVRLRGEKVERRAPRRQRVRFRESPR